MTTTSAGAAASEALPHTVKRSAGKAAAISETNPAAAAGSRS